MDPKVPNTSDYMPLTGSLIPITMKPRKITADGEFQVVLNLGQPQLEGVNILTLVALNAGTVADSLAWLRINNIAVTPLVKEFAQAIELKFVENRTLLLEGKVAEKKSVELSVICSTGQASLTVHGAD